MWGSLADTWHPLAPRAGKRQQSVATGRAESRSYVSTVTVYPSASQRVDGKTIRTYPRVWLGNGANYINVCT